MKLAITKKQNLPVPIALTKTALFKRRKASNIMRDVGLLISRLTIGGLLAAHGSQKLFGWFEGPGMKGTKGMVESMGLKPGTPWATGASTSEFGGGMLTSLGLLHPLGPMSIMGAMIMATAKAHWGKPIWASKGGAELPITNITSAFALMLTGPGRFSLDRLFGIRLPRALVIAVAIIEAILIVIGIMSRPTSTSAATDERQTAKPVTTGQSMSAVKR